MSNVNLSWYCLSVVFAERNVEQALYHAVRALEPALCLQILQSCRALQEEKDGNKGEEKNDDERLTEPDLKLLAIAVLE